MAEAEKLKKRRTAYKGHVTRVEREIRDLIGSDNYEIVKLKGLQNSYVDNIEKIKVLDNKIIDLLDDDAYDNELTATLTYHEGSFELLALLDSKTTPTTTQITPTVPPADESLASRSLRNFTKLPRMEIKKFDGNILNWQSFWDQFASAVHERRELTDIDKFNYLKSLLTDRAEEVIKGLALNAENIPKRNFFVFTRLD